MTMIGKQPATTVVNQIDQMAFDDKQLIKAIQSHEIGQIRHLLRKKLPADPNCKENGQSCLTIAIAIAMKPLNLHS